MRKHLVAIVCSFLIICGLLLMVCLGISSLHYTTSGEPSITGGTDEKAIIEKAISCDKFCKEKYAEPDTNIIGRLKTSPDGENLSCMCYRKRLNKNSI
jgi:hypothetical protein